MVCFCHVPLAASAGMTANLSLAFSPPTVPLQLRAALALGLGSTPRLDMGIAAYFASIRLPSVALNGGLMAQLKLALPAFDLFDLPRLQAQLALAAASFNGTVLPKLGFLLRIRLAPLINLAAIARLSLALPAVGLSFGSAGIPPLPPRLNLRFALTPPLVKLGHMLVGIPVAFKLAETFGSGRAGFTGLHAHLSAMARIAPPTINLALMLRLALVLDCIATIRAAFGINALTPSGLASIAASLRAWLALPLPNPMPNLMLAPKIDLLPPLPDIKLGAAMAGSSFTLALPHIPLMASLSAVLALQANFAAVFGVGLCPAGACTFG